MSGGHCNTWASFSDGVTYDFGMDGVIAYVVVGALLVVGIGGLGVVDRWSAKRRHARLDLVGVHTVATVSDTKVISHESGFVKIWLEFKDTSGETVTVTPEYNPGDAPELWDEIEIVFDPDKPKRFDLLPDRDDRSVRDRKVRRSLNIYIGAVVIGIFLLLGSLVAAGLG
jgi:hypothetical protein